MHTRNRKVGTSHSIHSVVENIKYYIDKLQNLIDIAWDEGETSVTAEEVFSSKELQRQKKDLSNTTLNFHTKKAILK